MRSPPSAPPVPAELPALPGFDLDNVRHWLREAPEAWYGMARAFVTEYPAAATAIRAALDAGDRSQARDLLHRLRGAAGALGAAELTDAAGHLELALASDGPVDAGLHEGFAASAEATLAVLAGVEAPAPQAGSAAGAEPDCGERSRRLQELAALLEAGNTRALEHLPWLTRCLDQTASGEVLELRRHIEALDFPAALDSLTRLTAGAATAPS